MEYTGERVIPKVMNPKNGLLIEHIARYKFARNLARGRVLDIACGVGYGAQLLLEQADEYVGIDICPDTVAYAKQHYGEAAGITNASFYVDDALDQKLYEKYGTFDTIISMETIEHFNGDELFLSSLSKLLKADGTLIISTPFGRGKDQPCSTPWHVYQYTEAEFIEVLAKFFANITMYHQIDTIIELPLPEHKYYLMVAVCHTRRADCTI